MVFVLVVLEKDEQNIYFAILVVGVIIVAAVCIKEKFRKPAPPIENLDEHIEHITSLPDQKSRQEYLVNRKYGDK